MVTAEARLDPARHPELVRDVEVALAVDRHPALPRLAADPGSGRVALVGAG